MGQEDPSALATLLFRCWLDSRGDRPCRLLLAHSHDPGETAELGCVAAQTLPWPHNDEGNLTAHVSRAGDKNWHTTCLLCSAT